MLMRPWCTRQSMLVMKHADEYSWCAYGSSYRHQNELMMSLWWAHPKLISCSSWSHHEHIMILADHKFIMNLSWAHHKVIMNLLWAPHELIMSLSWAHHQLIKLIRNHNELIMALTYSLLKQLWRWPGGHCFPRIVPAFTPVKFYSVDRVCATVWATVPCMKSAVLQTHSSLHVSSLRRNGAHEVPQCGQDLSWFSL